MGTGIQDEFEKGVFWELYKDLERQFENFLEYVPYLKGNEKVYSFRLLNLILSIGSHVDSAFKEMARHPKFSENKKCKKILQRASKRLGIIDDGVDAFNDIYGIANERVTFKRLVETDKVTPFNCDEEEKHPEWWTFYNNLKHDVGIHIEQATLQNTRDALAGAFLLNVIHTPAALMLFKQQVSEVTLTSAGSPMHQFPGEHRVRPTETNSKYVQEWLENREKSRTPFSYFAVETSLFKYDYVHS